MEEGAITKTTTSGNATTRNKVYYDRDRRLQEIQKCRSEKKRWEQETQKCRSETERWENRLKQLLEEDEMEKKRMVLTTSEGGIPGLHLVLQFLHAADVACCAQVCRQWNRYIDTHPNVWKMAAVNYLSAEIIENLFVQGYRSCWASRSSPELKPEDIPPPSPAYWKNVALGLNYKP